MRSSGGRRRASEGWRVKVQQQRRVALSHYCPEAFRRLLPVLAAAEWAATWSLRGLHRTPRARLSPPRWEVPSESERRDLVTGLRRPPWPWTLRAGSPRDARAPSPAVDDIGLHREALGLCW